jgi:hypothetical protein
MGQSEILAPSGDAEASAVEIKLLQKNSVKIKIHLFVGNKS